MPLILFMYLNIVNNALFENKRNKQTYSPKKSEFKEESPTKEIENSGNNPPKLKEQIFSGYLTQNWLILKHTL